MTLTNMNPLEANLNALSQRDPALAERVDSCSPPAEQYRIITTQTVPALEILHEDKWVAWHSRYDPQKEADREIAAINQSTVYLPMFIGMGLGYTLLELWKRWRDDLYDIVVIENNIHIFRLALETSDFSDLFAYPRFHIHVGDDLSAWKSLCRKIMPGVMSSRLQFIVHAPSRQINAPYYQQAVQILNDQIHTTQAEFDFTIRHGADIQQNLWRNLPAILRSMGTNQIHNQWMGKPAVVVAAGPSLDKNVHQLHGMEDRALIIAVDTALRTLIQHHISPHIVVSTDPTELNLKHFEGIAIPPHTVLAFDPEVHYGIPQQWKHRTLFMNLEKTSFTKWIEKQAGPYGFVPKGGSVGNTAFYLARILGADPIIFAGLDLAFDPLGGKTHAGASALTRTIQAAVPGSQTAAISALDNLPSKQENIVWVPGTQHEQVPTSSILYIYIQQFNNEIQQTSAKVIDATEGGARLNGAKIMSLQYALESYSLPHGVNEWVQSIQSENNRCIEMKQVIETFITEIEKAFRLAQDGLEQCKRVESLLHLGAALREHDEWIKTDEYFQNIYHSEAVKISMEQALFSAVFQFIHKEKKHEVKSRLDKYKNYFQSILQTTPEFIRCLHQVKSLLENSE